MPPLVCAPRPEPRLSPLAIPLLLRAAQNLEAVLKGAGMTLGHVVKANIYLSNLSRDFGAVNEVRSERQGQGYTL